LKLLFHEICKKMWGNEALKIRIYLIIYRDLLSSNVDTVIPTEKVLFIASVFWPYDY
jgi:hypothetical protein